MYIDDTELRLLLEKKRDKIGYTGIEIAETFLSGAAFIAANGFADYNIPHVPDNAIRTLCIVIGIIYIVRSAFLLMQYNKESYNHEKLYEDIKKLDKITHPFSIIAIKDTFNQYSNRYLLYYDHNWDCNLFLNYRTVENNNSEHIMSCLSNELQIPPENITVDFRHSEIYTKYSVSDRIDKIYEHSIYLATISNFTEKTKRNSFYIGDKTYKWRTISEMEADYEIVNYK